MDSEGGAAVGSAAPAFLQVVVKELWRRGGGGEEIFSIYERDFDSVSGGDIVYVALKNEKKGVSAKEKLFVCKTGLDEVFYFDMTQST
jgi:hypothetical protein